MLQVYFRRIQTVQFLSVVYTIRRYQGSELTIDFDCNRF